MVHTFQKISLLNKFLIVVVLTISIVMTNYLWHGDLLIHTDVARDLLVLKDIVDTQNLTLIGPRSSIPGVFHGPLWYYINLPIFFFANGNPIVMGWFWWSLGISASALFFYMCYLQTRKLTVSLLATIAFILIQLPSAAGPTNTYLANLVAFFPFFIWWRWISNPKLVTASLGWFSLGMLVQFQMAFVMPIALLWLPIFLYKIYKTKKYIQLPTILLFLLPLSTFVLFDFRHDWLQLNSVLYYLQNSAADEKSFFAFITERINSAFLQAPNIFNILSWLNLLVLTIVSLLVSFKANKKTKQFGLYFLYWYFGWWIITLFYSGTVWGFYYGPFSGIIVLVIATLAASNKKIFWLFVLLISALIINNSHYFYYSSDRFNSSSWLLLSAITKDALAEPNSGYFLYSQDQFAYPLKYAFTYYQSQHPEKQFYHYQKKEKTVLVKSQDDPANPWSTSEDWQSSKLGITIEPIEKKSYPYGYTMEKFVLDEQNLNSEVDPNLVKGLEFR